MEARQRFHGADVDELTAARRLRASHRGERGGGRQRPDEIPRPRPAGTERLAPGFAGDVEEAAGREVHEVVAAKLAIGTGEAESRERDVHDFRVLGRRGFVALAERAGITVGGIEDDVRRRHQPPQGRRSARGADVDRRGPLEAVEVLEKSAERLPVTAAQRGGAAPQRVALERLDLDDVRAAHAEKAPGVRDGDCGAAFDDSEWQRPATIAPSAGSSRPRLRVVSCRTADGWPSSDDTAAGSRGDRDPRRDRLVRLRSRAQPTPSASRGHRDGPLWCEHGDRDRLRQAAPRRASALRAGRSRLRRRLVDGEAVQRPRLAAGRGDAALRHVRRRHGDHPQHPQLRLPHRDRLHAALLRQDLRSARARQRRPDHRLLGGRRHRARHAELRLRRPRFRHRLDRDAQGEGRELRHRPTASSASTS